MDRLDAIKAFGKLTLNHPHLKVALQRLSLAVKQADQGSVVFIFGPTGAGKSTLATHMCEKLDQEFRLGGDYDDSSLPVALIEAPASDARQFSWKDFYTRALSGLREPLVDKKIDDPRCSVFKILDDYRPTGHGLRMAFENALELRKVQVLMIDEAHHIAKGLSAAGLKDQLEYIKSLANLTNTIIILIGTYELLSFRNLSGQLSRRSLDVHFRRYRLNDLEEHRIFGGIVRSFANKLPIPCAFQMAEKIEYLYTGSLGCVGILSGWLVKAMTLAVEEGDGTLKMEDLEQSMYSHDQMSKMIDELLEGEQLMTPPKNSLRTLKARLGVAEYIVASAEGPPKSGKTVKPFKRKPARDPVGLPA